MKALILALALAAGFALPAAAASWPGPGFRPDVQAQKGRGQEGGQRGREREARPERRGNDEQRPERLSDDERRALHRDLDKANRELYKPRPR